MDDSVEVELCKVRGKVKTVTRQTQQVNRKGRRPCSLSSFSLRALTFIMLKTKKFEENPTLKDWHSFGCTVIMGPIEDQKED